MTARRILIPVMLAIPPLMVLAVAALYPTDQLFPNQGDLNLYLGKAREVAAGGVPYRDFSFEYPPAALIPMVVPYLLGMSSTVDLEAYQGLFATWEAALLVVLGVVLVRIVRLGGDAAFDTAGAAGPGSRGSLGSMRREDSGAVAARQGGVALHLIVLSAGALLAITFRFDLFPALLMAAAVWAALARRPALVGVALALGVLAKLFPIAVLPALAVPWLLPLDLRGLARLGASFVATVTVGLLPFIVLAGSESTFQFLQYNAERGLQVESIGGGVSMLAGLVTGQPVEMNFRFSSVNVEGGVADAWLTLIPFVTMGGFALVALVGWRRVREETRFAPRISASTVVELAAVSLLMLLATSKVYSIQYAVWVVPLAALLGGPRFWLAAALVGLTMPIHPLLYEGLVDQEALPIIVLNLRNALLLVLLGWMLVDLRGARRDMTSVAGPGEPA